jgi:hypothetical protein
MGSNLQSSQMPESKRNAFLKVFSKLKQQVLWKWETDTLPGQPRNVKLGKWLPQSDILGKFWYRNNLNDKISRTPLIYDWIRCTDATKTVVINFKCVIFLFVLHHFEIETVSLRECFTLSDGWRLIHNNWFDCYFVWETEVPCNFTCAIMACEISVISGRIDRYILKDSWVKSSALYI